MFTNGGFIFWLHMNMQNFQISFLSSFVITKLQHILLQSLTPWTFFTTFRFVFWFHMNIQPSFAVSFVITKIATYSITKFGNFSAMDIFHVIRKSYFCAGFKITTFAHFWLVFCFHMKLQICFIMETFIALVELICS